MGRRQKEWARTARVKLILALGSKCSVCGTVQNLTFDCLTPQGSAHHAMESSSRMCFYRHQARQGNLGLLCAFCNALKQGCPLEVWLTALQSVNESRAIHQHSRAPGQGTALTERECRECLAEAVSRYLAKVREGERIKALSALV